MIVMVLLLLASASMASAENITYVYKTLDGDVLSENSTGNNPTVIVTLPDTTWNLDMLSKDAKFKAAFTLLNSTTYPTLDISSRTANLSIQDYDSPRLGLSNLNSRYLVKYAYALNISQLASSQYTVTIDTSGVSDPRLFNCTFDYTLNKTNTASCTLLASANTGSPITATLTGFASFFLAEDYCAGKCGVGVCAACTQNVPSGGGGGGGGGGGSGGSPKTIYVTPTPEGVSIQVFQGDNVIVQYNNVDYPFKVKSIANFQASLLPLNSAISYDVTLGSEKRIGLTSILSDDIGVSMHISNKFAVLTFRTIEKKAFSFPLLPAKPRTPTQSQQVPSAGPVQTTARPTVPITQPVTEAPVALDDIQLPESPINMWTILFALVFIIFLVGSIALYRARLHHLEKPPTVTRTGLESAGLPETSTEGSRPSPLFSEEKEAVVEAKPEVKEPVKEKIEQKPVKPSRPVVITKAKKLELEKYIFHVLGQGFKESQVKKVIKEKGWPEELVDNIFEEIRLKR